LALPDPCIRGAASTTFLCPRRRRSRKPKTRTHAADESKTHLATLLQSLTSTICTSIPGIKLQSELLVMCKDLFGGLSEGTQAWGQVGLSVRAGLGRESVRILSFGFPRRRNGATAANVRTYPAEDGQIQRLEGVRFIGTLLKVLSPPLLDFIRAGSIPKFRYPSEAKHLSPPRNQS
jgi:hypothetical protein